MTSMADERGVSDATILRDTAPAPRASAAFMRRHPAFLVLDRWLAPLGPLAWGIWIAASLGLGWWACTRTAQHLAVADPGAIVWDEVVAFWTVLWLVMPAGWLAQLVAFGLFRFFDAVKPGPVGWCDRHFKAARGWRQGLGILADDLVAALCTLLVIALWRFVTT
jgi:phosphatidylglycerophosphatase A